MTRRNARTMSILWGLAMATWLLTGCARRTPQVATRTPEPTFVPTVIASVEKTVVVGAQLVDCPGSGAGGGKCYLVKEEGAKDWTVFPGKIVGFDFWPGAEYTILVREDKIANPLPSGSDVIWTVLKGLYKSNVSLTPTAVP